MLFTHTAHSAHRALELLVHACVWYWVAVHWRQGAGPNPLVQKPNKLHDWHASLPRQYELLVQGAHWRSVVLVQLAFWYVPGSQTVQGSTRDALGQ